MRFKCWCRCPGRAARLVKAAVCLDGVCRAAIERTRSHLVSVWVSITPAYLPCVGGLLTLQHRGGHWCCVCASVHAFLPVHSQPAPLLWRRGWYYNNGKGHGTCSVVVTTHQVHAGSAQRDHYLDLVVCFWCDKRLHQRTMAASVSYYLRESGGYSAGRIPRSRSQMLQTHTHLQVAAERCAGSNVTQRHCDRAPRKDF
jgi:hypothetical protein